VRFTISLAYIYDWGTDGTASYVCPLPCCHIVNISLSFYFYSKTNKMHNFSSLLNITLHVSDGLSVHYQEFKTVHTVLDSWWWTERPSETCRVIFN